jgi:hypothetical protein
MDIFLEYLLLHLPKEEKDKKLKLLMLWDRKLKKSERKLLAS